MNSKWEYMIVVNSHGTYGGEVSYITPAGERKKFCGKDFELINTVVLLNQLGSEGWEVIAVTDSAFGGLAAAISTWTLRKIKSEA